MDFTAFSDDSEFDEYEWINNVFKNISKNEKETKVEEIVSQLKIHVQESNAVIDSTSASIVSSMPIIATHAKKLKQQAVLLKNKMNELEKDISKTETAFSMANLERLDNLKTKLEAAKHFLEQNDSFSRLTIELEDLLESENMNVTVAVEKLFGLKKSYEAQKNLAGDSEREIKLEEFKNRIEASMTSLVIKSLTDGNVEESQKYVEMFRKIDRLAEIKNYYNTIQRDSFQRHWIEISGSVENSDNPRFLSDFYEIFLSNWTKSIRWHREVFSSDGVLETITLITDTLSSLHPSRETTINTYLNRINEKMELLQDVSEANVKFSKAINEKFLESGVSIPKDKLTMLSHSIFNFFNIFIVKYSSLEQSSLDAKFDTLKIMQTSGSESVRSLENTILIMFDYINQLIERQSLITQDCSIITIIYILNTFFKTKFLEKFKKAQLQLDASRTDQQDWNLLQICISLIQNIGNFYCKLEEVETKIRKLILAKSEQIKNNEEFCYKIVGQRDINDFFKYVSRLESNEPTQLIIFESLIETIQRVAQDSHEMLLRNIFAPIDVYFRDLEISDAQSSSSADLPDFSLSPLTYITEIGQQLLLLPQHLEPLLLHPSKPLQLALELCDESYAENVPSADVLLSIIANKTCSVYQHKIKQINSINDGEAKQLATDIEYLESVLEELGLVLSNSLKHIIQLLKVKPQNYQTTTINADHKLFSAIRQMRNINISDESPQ
ncbi:putative Conserved oligomeric Golgi complex subunit 7 [Polypedilum vanderplanki]|uniref:Conserved oligomeric Golgi complex subunit 7 n=1 Tax=Polypedilum vanderplanki TaxID=319348 RepID=A0A9J6BV44_POLVA|nr:putative Conserved oligomeric Golgi complex subunit 7 [Polypedilum vanderplanki]